MHMVHKQYRICIRRGEVAIASSVRLSWSCCRSSKALGDPFGEELLPVEEMPQLEDSRHDAEAFALCGRVVLLCSSEASAPISDRMKHFDRFFLRQGTTDFVGECVSVDDKLSIGLWRGKFRWAQQCVAKVLKGGDSHVRRRWLIQWDFVPSQSAQGFRSCGNVLDETSIDIAQAQEAIQLGLCRWKLEVLESVSVLVMLVQLPGADNVSEVLDFVREPCALFQVQGNPGFAETVQNRVNILDVLFRVRGNDDDIF